jgi:hypothetical protein
MQATGVEALVDGLNHPEGVSHDHGSNVLSVGGEDGRAYAVGIARGLGQAYAVGIARGLAAPINVSFIGDNRRRLVPADSGRWHLTLLETEIAGSSRTFPPHGRPV